MQSIFLPDFWIRHRFVQSFLASKHFGKAAEMQDQIKTVPGILATSDAYLGYYLDIPENPKGLLILLHGWEGSSQSAYVLKTAKYFVQRGLSVARVNMRDHGGTAGLNEGPFNGSLFREVFQAIQMIAAKYSYLPSFLAGFSLGGNFVSRVAIAASNSTGTSIPNLRQVFAISPSYSPQNATAKIDTNPFLKRYFLRSWRDSLYQKYLNFPKLYQPGDFRSTRSVMELTEKLVLKYTKFATLADYFAVYTIRPEDLQQLQIPLTVLSSRDDPIIRVEDLHPLQSLARLRVILTNYGGHNGFLPALGDSKPYYIEVIEEGIRNTVSANFL
ncbi:MAG: alpha/beta fold hydrolase [Spirochaetota bacterium]